MSTWIYHKGILACDTESPTYSGKKIGHPVSKMMTQKLHGEWTAITGNGNFDLKNRLREWILAGQPEHMLPTESGGSSGLENDTVVCLAKPGYCLSYEFKEKKWTTVNARHHYALGGTEYYTLRHWMATANMNAIHLMVKAIKASRAKMKLDGRTKVDTDFPIQYWMPGMKKPGIITKKDWKANKKYWKTLKAETL